MACVLGIEQNCSECRMCSNTNETQNKPKNPNDGFEKEVSRFNRDTERISKQHNISDSHAYCFLVNYGTSNICRFENIKCTKFDKCSEMYKAEKEQNNKHYKQTVTEYNIKGLKNCICYCVEISSKAMKEAEFRNIKIVQVKNIETLLALEREHRKNTRQG